MGTMEAREEALMNFINNTLGGYKTLATTAVQSLPHSSLKILVEALDLEEKVKQLKKH